MADGPEGYVSGLVWEQPQQVVPEGAMLLKIKIDGPHDTAPFGIIASVIEGPESVVGTVLNFVPKSWNSCVGLGRLEGYVVVETEPISFEDAPGEDFYRALAYLPDPSDRSRGFKPKNNWFVPGAVAPEMKIPEAE